VAHPVDPLVVAPAVTSITIYQKPTCSTCRQVYAALRDAGVDFEAVNYYVDPIPRDKLEELIRKMGITPRQLLRTKEPMYRTLGLADATVTDAQIVDAMVANPDLIQRPIVEQGRRAILARPAERLKELL
jgi:arsenate reductase